MKGLLLVAVKEMLQGEGTVVTGPQGEATVLRCSSFSVVSGPHGGPLTTEKLLSEGEFC